MARIFAAARPRAPVCVMRWPSDLVHANSSSASDRQTHLSGVLPSSMMDWSCSSPQKSEWGK